MSSSLADQVQFLLFTNDIPFDKQELEFQIESHPSYPSLHSITGVLDHFNIDNNALDVPIHQDTLPHLPNYFLAQIEDENGKSIVNVTKNNNSYNLIFVDKKKQKISANEFLEKFTGIIVVVEKTETIEFKKNNSAKANTFFFIVSLILLIGLFFKLSTSFTNTLYFILSGIGIYVSISIIKQELGEKTLLGDTFCTQTSTSNNNCDTVLSSNGSQFGKHKLSDLSIVYFIGLFFSILFLTIASSNLTIVFALSLISISITIYTFYYQYIIVKQWCYLCLSITAVLYAQAILIISFNYNEIVFSNISLNDVLITFFSFITAYTFWNVFSPNIKLLKNLKEDKVKHYKFKRNYSLFEALLKKSSVVETTIHNASEIAFGNPNALLNITFITSPFCGHCKSVHTLIEQILKKHYNEVQIHIRFSANEVNEPLVNITSKLLELYHEKGRSKCLEAMHDIYGDLSPEQWFNKWGNTDNRVPYLNTLRLANEWCKQNKINFTPEILINGRSYPKEYERSELIYFIEDIHESTDLEKALILQES